SSEADSPAVPRAPAISSRISGIAAARLDVAPPDRTLAQGFNKGAVRGRRRQAWRQRSWALSGHLPCAAISFDVGLGVIGEPQHRLALTQELDVALGKQRSVHERAVLGALRVVDAITLAQSVQVVGPAGMLAACQSQGIHHPIHGDRLTTNTFELAVQKAD